MATFKNDRRVEVMSATGETVTAAYLLGIGEGRSMLKGMKARGEVIDAATISALIDNLTRCLAQGFAREMADTFRGERAFWRNQLRIQEARNATRGVSLISTCAKGDGPYLVLSAFVPDFVGVVMPMRNGTVDAATLVATARDVLDRPAAALEFIAAKIAKRVDA